MATEILTIEELKNLTSINQISLQEIDRRCAPVKEDPQTQDIVYDKEEIPRDNSEDELEFVRVLRSIRSQKGFISSDDSLNQLDTNNAAVSTRNTFLEVLERDWKCVIEHLKTTHVELATHLKNIIALCPGKYVKQATYSIGSAKPQIFEISHYTTRGFQTSLFTNLEKDQEESAWNDEYHIKNIAMDLSICIGGNAKQGVITYIEKYGFYEGGKTNPFRIDPMKLHAMLTGEWNTSVVEDEILLMKLKLAEQRETLRTSRQSIEEYRQKIASTKEKLSNLSKNKSKDNEEDIMVLETDIEDFENEILFLQENNQDYLREIEKTKKRIAVLEDTQKKLNHSQ